MIKKIFSAPSVPLPLRPVGIRLITTMATNYKTLLIEFPQPKKLASALPC